MKPDLHFKSIVLIGILILAPTSHAAKLYLPEAFELLSINGQAAKHGLFKQKQQFPLRIGLNKMVIQYDELFEGEDDDDFDIVKSLPILITFYVEDKQLVSLQYPHPKNAQAAIQYIKSPALSLITSKGKSIQYQRKFLHSDDLAFLLQATSIDTNRSIDLSSSADIQAGKAQVQTSEPQALAMLKYWWQKASEDEKRRFRKYIEH